MLSPWPRGAIFDKATTTWTPVYQQWLSALVREINVSAPVVFASLPTTPTIGQQAVVSDSNTNTWGAAVAGGGAFTVLAWWTGTAWSVVGIA